MKVTLESAAPFLGPNDPAPFQIINANAPLALQLICDHASNVVPGSLNALGLDHHVFERHIAYDIGAAAVTRNIANALNAPAVFAGFSRLVIDLNRPLGHPESMPETSDNIDIPGNHDLSETARKIRSDALFNPYHEAINQSISHTWQKGPAPVLFSIHSFTPNMNGEVRPWDVGILWNRDPRLALPLIAGLKKTGLNVGDNQPYSGRDNLAYTVDMHGTAAGLTNCVIEIRQDQIADKVGTDRWSKILIPLLRDVLTDLSLFQVQHF